jgi:hypothetical protein
MEGTFMTSVADTLNAIEARAERAIVQELRLMIKEVITLRPTLAFEDRSHADALLLKLDHLSRSQMADGVGEQAHAELQPPVPGMTWAQATSEMAFQAATTDERRVAVG